MTELYYSVDIDTVEELVTAGTTAGRSKPLIVNSFCLMAFLNSGRHF